MGSCLAYIMRWQVLAALLTVSLLASAQEVESEKRVKQETVSDRPVVSEVMLKGDSIAATKKKRTKAETETWYPKPKKALWLAIALPGGGQIYNKKYWKLPIVYGGFVGCAYAIRWNNMMYKDYSQAYLDIMDDDPTTDSYNQFLHLGSEVTAENEEQYKRLFKKRKDYYRRYRDMSIFALVGVYALSVIDAYVDASLADFDISKDLSLRITPAVIGYGNGQPTFNNAAIGVQCCLNF